MTGLNPPKLSIEDWLLAETVRHAEERDGRRQDDQAALALGRSAGSDLGQRLATRARALPGAAVIISDIARLRRWLNRAAGLLILAGTLAGWLAARASTSERHVDLLLATLALLGLPSLMLLLWMLLLLWSLRRSGSPSLLGRMLLALLTRGAPRLLQGPQARETVRAGLDLLAGPLGRWYLSSLSHLFWLAYAAGATLTLIVLFSVAQYDLSWGTTLLRDDTVSRMIQWLAAGPAQLGLVPPPDAAWVASGREGDLVGSQRAEWARLLLAVILIYGALPRLVLLVACSSLAGLAARRLNLDRRHPGYLRLVPLLQPEISTSRTLGEQPEPARERAQRRPANRNGSVLLVGIELDVDEGAWPPRLPGLAVNAIGRADRRDQRRTLVEALAQMRDKPLAVLAHCSLLRTPDTGIENLLNALGDAGDCALVLLLDDRERLQQRGGDLALRQADWDALARRVGGECLQVDTASAGRDELSALVQRLAELRETK